MNILAYKLKTAAQMLIEVADALIAEDTIEKVGQAEFNRKTWEVKNKGRTIKLSRAQADILSILLDSKGIPVSREEINVLRFGPPGATMVTRSTDTQVAAIRKVIGENVIRSVHGKGYCIDA